MGYGVLSRYRSELMGMAMLWVMLFHAMDLAPEHTLLYLFRAAGFGGVDIFLVLSAMGLVLSLSRREQSYGSFLARRAGRILPAYYTVMIPATLIRVGLGQAPLSTLIWNSTLLYYWVNPPGAFNWYVAGILLFYALLPPCWRFLKGRKRRLGWIAGGILLGLLVCRILVDCDQWSWLDVFYRVPVFFLGLEIGFRVREERKLEGKDLLFWAVWLGVGVAYLAAALRTDPDVFYLPECHLFLFTTVPMCLAVCWLFERLPLGLVRRFLRVVGENSLEIYLLNVSLFIEYRMLSAVFPFSSRLLHYLALFACNIVMGVLLRRMVEAGRARFRQAIPPR